MNDNVKQPKTKWHMLFGKLLEELLVPVGIDVYTEFPLMSNPPEADILLLKKNRKGWSQDQLKLLPDGIRDRPADHILIEFKYTESINEKAIKQTLGYDIFYKRSHKLPDNKVATFLVSAQKPGNKILNKFEYRFCEKPGLYKSNNYLLERIPLLSLNELENTPHNVFFKCFASRKKEKKNAFDVIRSHGLETYQASFQWFIAGLWENWFNIGGSKMEEGLTPERVIEIGKMWGKAYLSSLPPEERLAGLKPEDRLAGLRPEDRLAGLRPEDRLSGLRPEDRLAGLRPEDRLAGLKPKDRLAGLTIKEIEEYLAKIKDNQKD